MPQFTQRKSRKGADAAALARVSDLTFEKRPLTSLTQHNRAVRRHPETQLSKIMSSFATFGMISPLIVDSDGKVIAGEARLEVARRLKLANVPVIVVGHLTPQEARAYRIADNKLAEGATWDLDAFRDEIIQALTFDIDPEALGITMPELDVLLTTPGEIGESEDPIKPCPNPFVRLGDVFDLSDHALMCGDATDGECVSELLAGELADMAITDPPFNLKISGHVSTRTGARAHREFMQASGEKTPTEFKGFLAAVLIQIRDACRAGAVIEIFIDWRSVHRLVAAAEDCGLDYINLAVWAKTAAGMGSFLRSQHELVPIFAKPGAQPINAVMLGVNGRHRTNLWSYQGQAGFGRNRKEDLDRHPTPKPVPMIADAILDCTQRGDLVLDLFGGGGTTLIACERIDRRARVMEIDPGYVEASLFRYRAAFGKEPIHRQTGLTLRELEAQRRQEMFANPTTAKPMLALSAPDAPSSSDASE